MLSHTNHGHAQGFRQSRQWSADRAQTNNRHSGAIELAWTRLLVPQIPLRPVLLLLIPHGLRQSLGERERQRDGMLRHHRPVYIARIGHHDVAGAQFGCHEPMDCGGRRMNPSQSLSRLYLFSAQRPRDRDVGVRDFLDHAIVIGQMYNFELPKVAP